MHNDDHQKRRRPAWRKSSHSGGNNGSCVEFDMNNYGKVRDSKDPDGPVLDFTPQALSSFATAAGSGYFDTAFAEHFGSL
ncbi:DUF397 domain-containing protein [Kitasatospora sp. NBC_00070]|uniref:DUF397 domain-containing protein n=1 Tax=Kitasatospora sp. NBC_00070 TaxID=2975962 RepID=UPI0032464D7F